MTNLELIQLAEKVSEKSRCRRRAGGCVITDRDGNVLSTGYNGTPHAMPSCFEKPCPDAFVPASAGTAKYCFGVHSETRALLKAPIEKIYRVYNTKAPCMNCVLTLLETPCQEIYFKIPSKDQINKELWEAAGRKWTQIEEHSAIKDTITNRIDAVTDIPPEYYAEKIPVPKSVKIELTSKCNFHCSFCSHRLNLKKSMDMDRSLFEKLATDMRNSGVEELGLFYIGESLLCSWLEDAISFAKKIGFPYVFLTTNGSLATPERIESIMKAGLDSLKFSLNNADQWQFRNITSMAPSMFDTIKNNVKAAWHIRENGKYKTKLYAGSIKYDGKQKQMMQAFVDEIKPYVDEHYWLPLLSFGSLASDAEKQLGLTPVAGNPGRDDMMRSALPCWAIFKEGHITSEGKLSACCFDSSNAWIMADLNKVSFVDGWNSDKFQALRKAHISKNVWGTACEGCIYGK